jgi:hypothetical protein
MTSPAWPNNDFSLSALDALQSGLMVELIATPRRDLKTCCATDRVSEVVSANKEDQFDHLPVLSGASTDADAIVGMFHAAAYRTGNWDGSVAKHMEVLSERHLIGSDTSIIIFFQTRIPVRLGLSSRVSTFPEAACQSGVLRGCYELRADNVTNYSA